MKAPIKFEYFKELIEAIKEDTEYLNKCYELGLDASEFLRTPSLIVDVIQEVMCPNDPSRDIDGGILCWWIYDCEFGTTDHAYLLIDGEKHPITTIKDIYEVMCEYGKVEPVYES